LKFAQYVFAIAAALGIVSLTPYYFQRPPEPGAEFYYGFLGLAMAWQLAFILVAKEPVRYRWLMIPCALEKLLFAIPLIALRSQGRAQVDMAAAVMDLTFALLFIIAFAFARYD
jgi:hypothetical protein